MSDLHTRFGIVSDLEAAQKVFRNKLENILINGQLGAYLIDGKGNVKKIDIVWVMSNALGLKYNQYTSDREDEIRTFLAKDLKFTELLYRLQVFMDELWDEPTRRNHVESFAALIQKFVEDSIYDLGIRIKMYKNRAPQIYPSLGSKAQAKIVNKVLDLLEPEKYKTVLEHFEEGMKQFLRANSKAELKNVVEDLRTACDNLVKITFSKDSLGFAHLFRDDERWKKLGWNEYQKEIFHNLCIWMDKIKHDSLKSYDKADISMMIGVTSILFELIVEK